MSGVAEATASAGDKPKQWAVFDMNATQIDHATGEFKARIHEIRPGRRVPLRSDKPFYMDEGDARVFLKDEAFRVEDAEGNQVLPLRLEAQAREVPKRLEAEFVIAEVAELTTEALVTRIAQFPGGQQFSTETPRVTLIRFLVSAQRARDATNEASEAAPDGRDLRPEERQDIDRMGDPSFVSPKALQDHFG